MAGFKCSDFSSAYWKPITEDSEDHNSSSRYVDDDDDEGFVFFGNFFCNFVKYVDWRSSMQKRGMSQIWLRKSLGVAKSNLCWPLPIVFRFIRVCTYILG